MKIREMFGEKVVFSLEVFPPRQIAPVQTIYHALEEMKDLNPSFISVTYGAGGRGTDNATIGIASAIKHQYGIESVAHLTGFHLSREDVRLQLEKLAENGIENILALRGDIVSGIAGKGEFTYAHELIRFIKENGDFHVMAACYPEGHPESPDIVSDILNMKEKVDAGADHLVSQLFFDNEFFFRFRERAQLSGIKVPMEAGIMPVTNRKQIERMVSLCKVELPKKFLTIMRKYEDNPVAMREAGIAYAVDQIVGLIAEGVEGIHLYTMNNPYIAQRIHQAVSALI
ncbi:methylenetetrahydrofolate reductase [NAD(P)H] [Parasphaerochaeta coccoides]|uniref:Methylenetetrahydrofolate reductase n=1 Tax=Parasphaerochaeta coccoides (strain ATCC BAA-1237 / DSM 17374 / SPN1) TaxID=760011 RepID=F4GJ91_PARC1|nr:methylenetetrahydrofolate reductase [NAD(P)H] [Parasphaerochaeta coccoides]AEC01731.1 5,10-methylenetetrahydrofolate reductase [Parasphaerochaeta coccoides DSM 17374]